MSLFSQEPLTAIAQFHLPSPPAAPSSSDPSQAYKYNSQYVYKLFPEGPNQAPNFIGQMTQMKSLFRSAQCADEVSILLHKVGDYVILDQGPTLTETPDQETSEVKDDPLTLVPYAAMEKYVQPRRTGPGAKSLKGSDFPELPDAPRVRTEVKNTFINVIEDESDDGWEFERTRSLPAKLGARDQNNNANARNKQSLLPCVPNQRDGLEELVVAQGEPKYTRMDDVLLSLAKENTALPPVPSRFGRAVEWRFGDYVILLGCDMAVYQTQPRPLEYSRFCSFKLQTTEHLTVRERLDNWLENVMCKIPNTVFYNKSQKSMCMEETDNLPDEYFDPAFIIDQSERLLNFLKSELSQEECGTYWLFRERNSSRLDLFDLSVACGEDDLRTSEVPENRAYNFCSKSLRLPIASLCFRLARRSPNPLPLMRKGLRLLESVREANSDIYTLASLELAKYLGGLPPRKKYPSAGSGSAGGGNAGGSSRGIDHDAADEAIGNSDSETISIPKRLVLALRHVENVFALRKPIPPAVLHQAYVVHAESILKIVREILIPIYSTALKNDAWDTEKKQSVSMSGLMNRLGWLALATVSLDHVPPATKEVEARLLVADVLETFGDVAFALSRYPAEMHERLNMDVASSTSILQSQLDEWAATASGEDIPDLCSVRDAVEMFRAIGSPLDRGLLHDKFVRRHPLISSEQGTLFRNRNRVTQQQTNEATPMLSSFVTTTPPAPVVVVPPVVVPPAMRAPISYCSSTNNSSSSRASSPMVESSELTRVEEISVPGATDSGCGDGLPSVRSPHGQQPGGLPSSSSPSSPSVSPKSPRTQLSSRNQLFELVKDVYQRAYMHHGNSITPLQESKTRVGRKIANVYNEEARKLMEEPGKSTYSSTSVSVIGAGGSKTLGDSPAPATPGSHADGTNEEEGDRYNQVVALFKQALAYFMPHDLENAAVVYVNLAAVHFQAFLRTMDYTFAQACIDACTKALDDCKVGQRDLAYYHMRIAVALSSNHDAVGPSMMKASSYDHLMKAMHNFSTSNDKQEMAVCQFHAAQFHAQQDAPSDTEISLGLRYARKSLAFWSRDSKSYPMDTIQTHILVARFQAKERNKGSTSGAIRSLAKAEQSLIQEWSGDKQLQETYCGAGGTTIKALRTAMGQLCQQGLKEGGGSRTITSLKDMYRKILRNEPL